MTVTRCHPDIAAAMDGHKKWEPQSLKVVDECAHQFVQEIESHHTRHTDFAEEDFSSPIE